MGSKRWWFETLERMVKTAAQAFLGMVGADRLLLSLPWDFIWQFTATMMLLSLATSIVTTKIGPDKGSPSLV